MKIQRQRRMQNVNRKSWENSGGMTINYKSSSSLKTYLYVQAGETMVRELHAKIIKFVSNKRKKKMNEEWLNARDKPMLNKEIYFEF